MKCDINTGYCTKLYSTDYNGDKTLEFGCGSPPQKIKVDEIEYFLGLGHIRINRPEAIRKNFFYLFTSEPPFKIIKKGNLFNIVDKSKKIEFGSGMIIRDNKKIIIAIFRINGPVLFKNIGKKVVNLLPVFLIIVVNIFAIINKIENIIKQ